MDRRPRARIGGKILTQLFGGAGAGKTNNNAKRRAKTRQNAARATRGGKVKRATGVLAAAGSSSGGPSLPPAGSLPVASSSGSIPSAPSAAAVAEEEEEMIHPLQPQAPRRTVRNRLKNFRASRAAAEAAAAPKKAANKAAREKAAANKAAAELERLTQLVMGNGSQSISRMNRFRIARHSNRGLKTALAEFNKRAANKAAAAGPPQRTSLNRLRQGTTGAFGAMRGRAAGAAGAVRGKLSKMQENRKEAAEAKATAKQEANNAIFARMGNQYYTTLNNHKLLEAKALLKNYKKLHPLQMNSKNNQRIRNLRNKIKAFEANKNELAANEKRAAAEEVTRATINKLMKLNNNNPEFLVGYKQLGMFGRRKLAPGNKRNLNAKYNRIMKAKANKAKANKAAANKAKSNNAAQRKMQINSQLNEYLRNVNAATIRSRIPTNLNGPFKGWRKVANKEKLRLLEVKLKPVPVFNNAALRKAVRNHFSGVKPVYNKALINAILAHPNIKLTNEERRRLTGNKPPNGGGGGGFFGGLFGQRPAGGRATTGGGFFSGLFAPKPPGPTGPSSFIPFKKGMKIPFGYVLKKNKKGLGYYKNNKELALESQLEHRGYGPAPKPVSSTTTGVSVGVGPGPRNRNRYGYGYGYGYENNYGYGYGNRNRRGGGAGGGIVFKPQITVGAARIGAQTFGGTRVGGQQMGGSRLRGGNTGSTTLKTGSTQVSNVGKVANSGRVSNSGTTSNAGRLAVSAPTSSGNRQLAATPEQLIRGAGGAEAVEKGIDALRNANGNVAKAKAASRLPNSTFTNIYAMGGPNAAKRLVETRRRRRMVGGRRVYRGRGLRAPTKKKRVAPKPRKQYIKLTPYQFKRLTDHIKKNNLRRVLIKEITH